MAKALICDRCGKTHQPTFKRKRLSVIDSRGSYTDERYLDLCPECEDKLFKFMFEPDDQES